MATRKTTQLFAASAPADTGGTAVADPPPAAPPPAVEAAAPAAHPPITAYRDVWVHKQGVALANKQVGFLTVLAADAATMIANGDALDPYTTDLPYIDTPPVVTVTGFTAVSQTVATASQADVAKLKVGDHLYFTQTGGTHLAALDGKTATVMSIVSPTTFKLAEIDLSGANVAGVTARGSMVYL